MEFVVGFFAIPLIILIGLLMSAIKVVREYERLVVFRLGRIIGAKGPGLVFIIPIVDQVRRVSTRIQVIDVQPQDLLTKDNVSVQVNAVIYFRVLDPNRAVLSAENYYQATVQIAQTTLRAVIGETLLQTLLDDLALVNSRLQEIIDEHTDAWGVKVSTVEIKHVDLTHELRRVMAAEAEAERVRKAKIVAAEGEFQASRRLSEAAAVMSQNPMALTLRYLQTLVEVASENNSTTIFPVPIDLFEVFTKAKRQQGKTPPPPEPGEAPPDVDVPPLDPSGLSKELGIVLPQDKTDWVKEEKMGDDTQDEGSAEGKETE